MKSDKKNFSDRIFGTLSSLKLAVVVTSSLAVSLMAGTILESVYDTPTSQYMVYRSHWFHFVLALLGVNIFFVMVSRWPWKKRHAPFLVAHIGILMLLGGSWVTEQFGLDGSLRVAEGETQNVVELDEAALVLTEGEQARKVPIPWLPPDKSFHPISVRAYGLPYDLTIDQFITHADPTYSFVPAAPEVSKDNAAALFTRPAVRLKLEGGPMNIVQEFWLWTGDPSFQSVSMGPARLAIIKPDGAPLKPVAGRTDLTVVVPDGGPPEQVSVLKLLAHASDGTPSDLEVRSNVRGNVQSNESPPKVFTPKNWKGNIRISVLEYVPNASVLTTYHPARIQYGQGAPTAAIHVITGRGGPGSETWLGLGDRAVMHLPGEAGGSGRQVNLGYLPKRVVLPFAVKLERFKVERYQGTIDPSSYSSLVSVTQGTHSEQTLISMNEPLTAQGITLYQASYEDAQPRPTVSILSVNRDPGRPWKYWGSILLVGGSILLFASKYRRAKPAPASTGVSA